MAPYFCYTHHGLYVKGDDDKCYHEQCLAFADKVVRPTGFRVAGFAGSTVTKAARQNSEKFHKDMYAYKDAVDQGVKPEQITVQAAESALKTAEAIEHGA